MSDMKKALDIINSRLHIAGEMTSELEDIAIEYAKWNTEGKYRIKKINRISISLGVTSKSLITTAIRNWGRGMGVAEKYLKK